MWLLFGAFMIIIMFFGLAFWLWMLIDVMKRKSGDKLSWVLVIVFLNVLGAVLYYFMVYRAFRRKRR